MRVRGVSPLQVYHLQLLGGRIAVPLFDVLSHIAETFLPGSDWFENREPSELAKKNIAASRMFSILPLNKHYSLQDVFNFTLEQTLQPPGCFGFYPWTSKNNATLWVWYTIGSNQLWGTISWESHPSPHSAAGSVSSNGLASRRLIGSSLGAIHWSKVHVEHRITSHWSRDLVSEHPAGNGRRLKPYRSPKLWPRLLQWLVVVVAALMQLLNWPGI